MLSMNQPSDRQQQELELLSDLHHLEAFFSQSQDGFFFMMLDRPMQWNDTGDREALLDYVFSQQRVTKVNAAMLAQYGATEDEFIGLTPQDFFAHDLETGRQLWREMFDQGRIHIETLEHKLDGTSLWIEVDYSCLYNSGGEIVGHFGIQRDVSDRKANEIALQASERRYATLAEAVPVGIFRTDTEGHCLYVNERWCQMTGLTFAEAQEDGWAQTLHPDDRDRVFAKWYDCAQHNLPFQSEYRFQKRNGDIIWVVGQAVAERGIDGELIGYVGSITDISDRKQIEEALRESEERLQALLDNSTAVIYMKDTLGRYIMINHRYEDLFHLDRNEVKGKTDRDIFPKEIADVFQANDREVIAAGVALETEEVAPQDDGLHTYLSIKFPLFDTEGTIYAVCGMSTDISDRKQAEIELQNQKQDLTRSNAELQQFAYVASHDLQEPLRMVVSYLELLERRYKGQLDAKADVFIGYAVDGATRMQTLINDLLNYSRVGTRGENFETVDCDIIVQNALRNLQVAIAQSNAVITYDTLPQVQADSSQLTQLFQNLIGNAIKFRGEEPPQIHIAVERTDDKWLFSVKDNGIGIEPQYLERIFIIFQRLHSRTEYPGTGIGLSVCKKIVERHGGSLWVESQSGRGSTFHFTLPQLASNP